MQNSGDNWRPMRDRAYELAESGRYDGWPQIKRALQSEAYSLPQAEARGGKLFRELVTARCRRARRNRRPFPSLAAVLALIGAII